MNRIKPFTQLFALVMIAPILGLFVHQWDVFGLLDVWFTADTYRVIYQTLQFAGYTFLFTLILGVLAGISSLYLPFRWARLLHLLPLTIPLYIGTFAFGFIQGRPGWDPLSFLFHQGAFSIMTLSLVFSFFLYPYVYLGFRIGVLNIRHSEWNTLQLYGSLWKKGTYLFRKMAPAITGGVFLAVFEVLNEFGAIKYGGFSTLTTAVFDQWFSRGNLQGGIYLAQILLILALLINYFRNRVNPSKAEGSSYRPKRKKPVLLGALLALIPLTFGFIIPLIIYIYGIFHSSPDLGKLTEGALNSLLLGGIMVAAAALLGLPLIYSMYQFRKLRRLRGIFTAGYTIPGAILAIGFLGLVQLLAPGVPWFISAPFVCLAVVLFIRLFALWFSPMEARGMQLVPSTLKTGSIFGWNNFVLFFRVWIPHMRPALWGASLYLLIDTIKELPITLLLRPFNFNTLSTLSYEYAEDELLLESFHFGIWIIIIGIITLILHERIEHFTTQPKIRK